MRNNVSTHRAPISHRHAGVATEITLIATLFVVEAMLCGIGWILGVVAVATHAAGAVDGVAAVVVATFVVAWIWVLVYSRVEIITVGQPNG